MGTPDFVAPETLLMGSQVDARADLDAAAVMLYQMLCGRIPRGVFDVPRCLCGCDPRFDYIVIKAMQNDRQQRYQSAHEMHCDLDAIYSHPLPDSLRSRSPPGASPNNWRIWSGISRPPPNIPAEWLLLRLYRVAGRGPGQTLRDSRSAAK
jgi:serine/threonine protein kinase